MHSHQGSQSQALSVEPIKDFISPEIKSDCGVIEFRIEMIHMYLQQQTVSLDFVIIRFSELPPTTEAT
ncbi:hypothetical protein TNCV_364751 [Trichonephila clavipes]|nr:hypothetical protein TNCV_364751 [Trichonephila clavipes]